jgi:hypothetical protein
MLDLFSRDTEHRANLWYFTRYEKSHLLVKNTHSIPTGQSPCSEPSITRWLVEHLLPKPLHWYIPPTRESNSARSAVLTNAQFLTHHFLKPASTPQTTTWPLLGLCTPLQIRHFSLQLLDFSRFRAPRYQLYSL